MNGDQKDIDTNKGSTANTSYVTTNCHIKLYFDINKNIEINIDENIFFLKVKFEKMAKNEKCFRSLPSLF